MTKPAMDSTTKTVTLNAIGDICLGDSLISLGFGIRSTIAAKGPEHLFRHAAPILQDADFLFGNLECVLSDEGWDESNPKSQYLRGTPAAIEALTPLGFDVLNVANNHTLQYGPEAWQETLAQVREAGIETLGTSTSASGSDSPYHSPPVILSRNGLRIGILGYSYEHEQYFEGPPLYAVGDREHILADLNRLRTEVDFTVISLHWGLEYMSYPSGDMVDLAHGLIDAGCDAILGHHPHVLQGTERYGQGVIAYSLGNFIFDKMWWDPCLDTAIAKLKFTTGPERRVDLEMIPLRINSEFQPVQPAGAEVQRAQHRLEKLDRKVHHDAAAKGPSYGLRQKFILQLLNVAKMGHIFANLSHYKSNIRRHLILRKVLRIS